MKNEKVKNGIYIENNTICHYLDNQLHNSDGPAIEGWLDEIFSIDNIKVGDKTKKWFIYGKQLSEEEFNHYKIKEQLNKKLHIVLKEKSKVKRNKI